MMIIMSFTSSAALISANNESCLQLAVKYYKHILQALSKISFRRLARIEQSRDDHIK